MLTAGALQTPPEGCSADAQLLGSLGFVAPAGCQHAFGMRTILPMALILGMARRGVR